MTRAMQLRTTAGASRAPPERTVQGAVRPQRIASAAGGAATAGAATAGAATAGVAVDGEVAPWRLALSRAG